MWQYDSNVTRTINLTPHEACSMLHNSNIQEYGEILIQCFMIDFFTAIKFDYLKFMSL